MSAAISKITYIGGEQRSSRGLACVSNLPQFETRVIAEASSWIRILTCVGVNISGCS
jgi:hypothetical protein